MSGDGFRVRLQLPLVPSTAWTVLLMLIVDLRLCRLDQLLELDNLVFEELDCILSGGLLSLKELGELERRLELTGEGFEVANDVLWNVGYRLRL